MSRGRRRRRMERTLHRANEIGDRKRLVNTEVYSPFKRFTLSLSLFPQPHETFCKMIMAPFPPSLPPMKRVGK